MPNEAFASKSCQISHAGILMTTSQIDWTKRFHWFQTHEGAMSVETGDGDGVHTIYISKEFEFTHTEKKNEIYCEAYWAAIT